VPAPTSTAAVGLTAAARLRLPSAAAPGEGPGVRPAKPVGNHHNHPEDDWPKAGE